MPKFMIERDMTGAGQLTAEQWQEIAKKSCCTVSAMDNTLQWLESFVTADKVYCVYIAPDEATLMEHAQRGAFPANKISQISSIIDPTTAESV